MKKFLMAAAIAVLAVTGCIQYQRRQMTEEIAEKIIRFHVLANSDAKEDQKLKLRVRDAVGSFMQPKLLGVSDIAAGRAIIKENLSGIEQEAERVIETEGYTYDVSARLTHTDFPKKTYGPYTFQAGNYEALQLTIGEGGGQNWWCVMYPNLCFFGSTYEVVEKEAEKSLECALTPKEYKSLMEDKNYEVKFAFQEFWENIWEK